MSDGMDQEEIDVSPIAQKLGISVSQFIHLVHLADLARRECWHEFTRRFRESIVDHSLFDHWNLWKREYEDDDDFNVLCQIILGHTRINQLDTFDAAIVKPILKNTYHLNSRLPNASKELDNLPKSFVWAEYITHPDTDTRILYGVFRMMIDSVELRNTMLNTIIGWNHLFEVLCRHPDDYVFVDFFQMVLEKKDKPQRYIACENVPASSKGRSEYFIRKVYSLIAHSIQGFNWQHGLSVHLLDRFCILLHCTLPDSAHLWKHATNIMTANRYSLKTFEELYMSQLAICMIQADELSASDVELMYRRLFIVFEALVSETSPRNIVGFFKDLEPIKHRFDRSGKGLCCTKDIPSTICGLISKYSIIPKNAAILDEE